jgi:hypothetical protein
MAAPEMLAVETGCIATGDPGIEAVAFLMTMTLGTVVTCQSGGFAALRV